MIIDFSKKKFLFISWESLSGDLAWNLKKEGHEVKCYIRSKSDTDVYQGFLERVQDWKKWVKWADVVVFDDVYFGRQADQLRKIGKFVVGGSKYTDALEIDREFGQEELLKRGVGILPYWNFKDYDKAIKFIKKNPARYVFKPCENGGHMTVTSLMFLGQDENGKDLLDLLEKNKDVWTKKVPIFQLQKYIAGVEIAVGAFFNGQDFIYPININFEHKRLFPGDLGPFTGEMGTLTYWDKPTNSIFTATLEKMKPALVESGYHGYIDLNCIVNDKGIYPLEWTCFSEDTEILTKDGWKLIKDVERNDVVATLTSKSHYLEYQKITGKIVKQYHGKMINIGGAGTAHEAIDCLITPDHQMYIKKRNGKFDFVRADAVPQGSKIKRTCRWKGKMIKKYVVPGYIEKHYLGKYHRIYPIKHPAIVMSMEAWLKFLGIFIAEGSIGGRKHFVSISQFTKREAVKKLFKNFPFKIASDKKGFQISSTQLVRHLESYGFGNCSTKYVPAYVKSLSVKQIKIFLDAFRIGDGNIHKRTGQISYFSTSKKLIDDIQELLLKCGIVGNIRKVNSKGTKCWGTKYFRNYDIYWISERKIKTDFYVDKRNIKEVSYQKKVYCVEVPNHIIYVRRNGKAFWCGNCRFGYPTIPIQLEGITMSSGEWLYKLAKGEQFELKTKKGFQIGVRIMVPTYFADESDKAEINTYRDLPILFKKPDYQSVHIEDIKMIDGIWRIAGSSGCLLVVTGSGVTVDEARKKVYRRLENINIQNMFYRVDIGTRWFHDSDKLQTWGYL